MQAQVLSGDGHSLPLTMRQSEGSEVEMEMGVRMKLTGCETSVGLGSLGQRKAEKARWTAVEYLQRGASTGVLETQERWPTACGRRIIVLAASGRNL